MLTLDLDADGHLAVKCQVTDYVHRGLSLTRCNVVDFFTDTYEKPIKGDTILLPAEVPDGANQTRTRRGRPRNERVPYLATHPKARTVYRMVRTPGHNTLPTFTGRWFPRADDADMRPFYCASMLLLLKPWRDVRVDLKVASQSWEEAFINFVSNAPQRILDMISGIQYFHECRTGLDTASEDNRPAGGQQVNSVARERWADDEDVGDDTEEPPNGATAEVLTEELLAEIEAARAGSVADDLHGAIAVEEARRLGIFPVSDTDWVITTTRNVGTASGDDLRNLIQWKRQMADLVKAQNSSFTGDFSQPLTDFDAPSVRLLDQNDLMPPEVVAYPSSETAEEALPALGVDELRADQRRAYDIATWHLHEYLQQKNPPPLRMRVHGEGGTGKSRIIQTITAHFHRLGVPYMLLKAAYTGVAASLIDGKTTHTIGMLSLSGKPMTEETRRRLVDFWKAAQYLILDEISMLAKTFFARLSKAVSVAKQGGRADNLTSGSFGGISVILFGDFHQFPPVASRRRLFVPVHGNR